MLPDLNQHTNKLAKERYKDDKRVMFSKSFAFDWDFALLRYIKRILLRSK